MKCRNLDVKSSSLFPLQGYHQFLSALKDNQAEMARQLPVPAHNSFSRPFSFLLSLHSLLTPCSSWSLAMPGASVQFHTFSLARGSAEVEGQSSAPAKPSLLLLVCSIHCPGASISGTVQISQHRPTISPDSLCQY